MKLIKIFQKVKARLAYRESPPEFQTAGHQAEKNTSLAPTDVFKGAAGDRIKGALSRLGADEFENVRTYEF